MLFRSTARLTAEHTQHILACLYSPHSVMKLLSVSKRKKYRSAAFSASIGCGIAARRCLWSAWLQQVALTHPDIWYRKDEV